MSLSEKHVAVLVGDFYQELEVWYPLYRLREAGVRVSTVGTGEKDTFPSKLGYPCTVDLSIDQVEVEDYDGVVIPGGWAPDFLRRHPAVNQFVADLNEAGKVIACICHGGWVLCSAHMLQGRTATSFSAIKDDLINAGATWVDEEVVIDGNLITARKPDDLPAFMKAMLRALEA